MKMVLPSDGATTKMWSMGDGGQGKKCNRKSFTRHGSLLVVRMTLATKERNENEIKVYSKESSLYMHWKKKEKCLLNKQLCFDNTLPHSALVTPKTKLLLSANVLFVLCVCLKRLFDSDFQVGWKRNEKKHLRPILVYYFKQLKKIVLLLFIVTLLCSMFLARYFVSTSVKYYFFANK